MDEKTLEIIKKRFDALPESIQEVILSSNYQEVLVEVGSKYQLNVEKMGILERETTMVMMGLVSTKDFEVELTRELMVDKIKGAQIVKDVGEKVFSKIRELLKLINIKEGEEVFTEKEQKANTEEDTDKEILSSSGIEIIEEEPKEILPEVEKLELNSPKNESAIDPIFTKKLSGFVKNEVKETDHSLNNLTKNSAPVTPNEKPQTPRIDPYREIPE